jgi:hypothetical protein
VLILTCIIPLALFEMRPVELDLMFLKRFSTRGIEIVICLSIQQAPAPELYHTSIHILLFLEDDILALSDFPR